VPPLNISPSEVTTSSLTNATVLLNSVPRQIVATPGTIPTATAFDFDSLSFKNLKNISENELNIIFNKIKKSNF